MAASSKWNYQALNVAARGFFHPRVDPEELTRLLNERGAQGWELVTSALATNHRQASQLTLIFKRPG